MTQKDVQELATLATLGNFIESRISRGAVAEGERDASDAIMRQIRAATLSDSPSDADSSEVGDLLKANADLKADLDRVEDIRNDLLTTNAALTNERDTLKSKVAELEAAQPANSPLADREAALEKISSVNRVSDTMAAEIYDALTK